MTDVVHFNSSSRADCRHRDGCDTHVANQNSEKWGMGYGMEGRGGEMEGWRQGGKGSQGDVTNGWQWHWEHLNTVHACGNYNLKEKKETSVTKQWHIRQSEVDSSNILNHCVLCFGLCVLPAIWLDTSPFGSLGRDPSVSTHRKKSISRDKK